jgi:membrane glycosyltransferase
VLSYATSPLWLAALLLSTISVCLDAINGYQYFSPGSYSLFPTWPQYRDNEIVILLGGTIGVLLMPKVLGATLALVNRKLRRSFGGGFKLLMSLVVEQVFSTLLAPSMMLFHTTFVVTTLLGHPVTWNAQDRGDRGITFLEALSRHKWHVLIGLAWGALILVIAPRYIWWMSPILIGLLLSVPLTMLTSLTSAGVWTRKHGLLLTPEETEPPPELTALEHLMATGGIMATPPGGPNDDLRKLSGQSNTIRATPPAQSVPEREPLSMEASVLEYLRPRDALTLFHRVASTPPTAP